MRVRRIIAAAAVLLVGAAFQAIPAAASAVTVSFVSPSTLPQGAPYQDVTIDGSGFNAGAVVTFAHGVTVNSTRYHATSEIIVNVTVASNATLGPDTITVTDSGGVGAGACTTCFSVSVTPSFGFTQSLPDGASNQDISLFGSNFMPGATANAGPGVTINDVLYSSPNEITVQVSVLKTATVGARTFTVTNPGSGGTRSAACTTCLTISNTPIVFMSASLPQGAANQDLTVAGSNFIPGATASGGSGITVNNVVYRDPFDITINVSVAPSAAQTTHTITVTNHINGTNPLGSCTACLRVSDVPSFSAGGSLPQGASNQAVSINGDDFMPGATATGGTGVTINNVDYTGPFNLSVSVTIAATATIGSHVLTITNHVGAMTYSGTGTFTVSDSPVPTMISMVNGFGSTLPQGAAQQVGAIYGANFMPGATVAFPLTAHVTVNTVQYESASELKLNISVASNATQGNFSPTVTNHAGATSYVGTCITCFNVSDMPHGLLSFFATYEPPGASHVDLLFFGADFMPGITAAFTIPGSTSSGGVTINALTYENPGQITVNVSVAVSAPTGARTLTLLNHANSTTYSGLCYTCFVVGSPPP